MPDVFDAMTASDECEETEEEEVRNTPGAPTAGRGRRSFREGDVPSLPTLLSRSNASEWSTPRSGPKKTKTIGSISASRERRTSRRQRRQEVVVRQLSKGGPAPEQKLTARSPGTTGRQRDHCACTMFGSCMRPPIEESDELQAAIEAAVAPVFLNVYELGHGAFVRGVNAVSRDFLSQGGIFHVGIEVHGKEWSFGATTKQMCGIFPCLPRLCSMHSYRETVYLGDCGKSDQEVKALLRGIKNLWPGTTYNWLHKNCIHFAAEFCELLNIGELPRWTHRLADLGAKIDMVTSGGQVANPSAGNDDDEGANKVVQAMVGGAGA